MTVDYTYSIQNDFPNHVVATDRLSKEIRESAIQAALDGINTGGDNCTVMLKANISGDKTKLDGLVAAHSGEPLPSESVSVTVENKPIVRPNIYPDGYGFYACGVGDDIEHEMVGGGTECYCKSTTTETKAVEFQFIDKHYMFGGGVHWKGAVAGDRVSILLYAPATPVVENITNTGNCNLVDIGAGPALIVPAAGDGAYDVDLSEASPVPSPDNTGYFDWSAGFTGWGTVSVSTTPGAANFHLFSVDIVLTQYINRVYIIGEDSDEFDVGSTAPAEVCPQWVYKVTVHNSTEKTLEVTWHPWMARARSV